MSDSDSGVLDRLISRLSAAGVDFERSRHAPVYTSAEAAAIRGTSLHSGAKALILKGDDRFVMAVLPADLALDGKALRQHLGWKGLRFATVDEVRERTGLTPGSIPPFGSLFGLATYCDERLADNESINFNAGSHSESIHMGYAAYAAFERPIRVHLARPLEPKT